MGGGGGVREGSVFVIAHPGCGLACIYIYIYLSIFYVLPTNKTFSRMRDKSTTTAHQLVYRNMHDNEI